MTKSCKYTLICDDREIFQTNDSYNVIDVYNVLSKDFERIGVDKKLKILKCGVEIDPNILPIGKSVYERMTKIKKHSLKPSRQQ